MTHGIRHHRRKLVERELAVAIAVRLHDRLVHDLLQLLVLQVVAHHHLQHEEQLAVRDEPVAVDVIHLERDCPARQLRQLLRNGKGGRGGVQRSFSSRPPRLLNALSPPTNSWKSTVPPPLDEMNSVSVRTPGRAEGGRTLRRRSRSSARRAGSSLSAGSAGTLRGRSSPSRRCK